MDNHHTLIAHFQLFNIKMNILCGGRNDEMNKGNAAFRLRIAPLRTRIAAKDVSSSRITYMHYSIA